MVRKPRYTQDQAREAVAASSSYSEALRHLGMRPAGGNLQTLRKYVQLWGLSIAHFDLHAKQRLAIRRAPVPLATVLVVRSTYSRGTLKRRLYDEGLKERLCELCGQGEEWQGRRMSLILDHINGVADDHRLENLQIVCPNCAATLDTHCGRNARQHRLCAHCETPFFPANREVRHCSRACAAYSPRRGAASIARRMVGRPPEAELRREVAALGYSAVGRRYGVSDNAIRKWLRSYERERAEGS